MMAQTSPKSAADNALAPLFNEEIEMVDGQLVVPDRPGTGFTFRR